jgi:hypothetical protein
MCRFVIYKGTSPVQLSHVGRAARARDIRDAHSMILSTALYSCSLAHAILSSIKHSIQGFGWIGGDL